MEHQPSDREFESRPSTSVTQCTNILTTTITIASDEKIDKRRCSACNNRIDMMKNPKKRSLQGLEKVDLREFLCKRFKKNIPEDGSVCNNCYQKYNIVKDKNKESEPSSSQRSVSSEVAELNIENKITVDSAKFNEHQCLICKAPKRNRLPAIAALEIFIKHRIYIKSGARCCKEHIDDGCMLKNECIDSLEIESKDQNAKDIHKLLDDLCNEVSMQRRKSIDSFDNWTEQECKIMTSFSKTQIKSLISKYKLNLRNTKARSVSTALAVYLTKLKSGFPNKHLSVVFHLTVDQIKRCIKTVRNQLKNTIVKEKLGLENINREMLKSHMTTFAKELMIENDNQIVSIWDGTYAYIQKSGNNRFQRQSWSVQKNRSLIKPFVACAPDGYILNVYGPFQASMNDAKIMKEVMEKDPRISIFEQGDVFLVDRGFRDVKSYLEEKGYTVKMPECLSKNQKQLTTEQANKSRLVTKVRYMVEVVNGKLKSFRLLDRVRPNTMVPSLGADFKIAASLINEFFRPPTPDSDEPFIAQLMKSQLTKENALRKLVDEKNLERVTTQFEKLNAEELSEFPRLEIEDLKYLTLGSYQLKQSLGYYSEHISKHGVFLVEKHKEISGLIRCKLQSRHSNRSTYTAFVKYESSAEGRESITGYTCQCKNGLRTVGMCSHVTTIIWYLGHGRYQQRNYNVAEHLNQIFTGTVVDDSDSE